ncbi:unnamed protein product [Peniophora sp. CBMAI 1063]|nr:unnamed protein product [Peniophora sp. CBMAI 1063]
MSAAALKDLPVAKMQHVAYGLFIWEWVTSLRYELDVYCGRRAWKWTFLPYLLCRFSYLGAIVCLLLGLDARDPFSCVTWARFVLLMLYGTIYMASVLIALRTVAIWNRNRLVVAFSLSGTLVLLALLIYGVVEAQAFWDNQSDRTCIVPSSEVFTTLLPMLTSTLAVDMSFLLLMLWGLLRLRDARRWGIGRFLWTQGIVWLMIAAAAEVPTVVVLALNRDNTINEALRNVLAVSLVIAATRMYRSLTDFLLVDRVNMSSHDEDSSIKLRVFRRFKPRHTPLPENRQRTPVAIEICVEQESGM